MFYFFIFLFCGVVCFTSLMLLTIYIFNKIRFFKFVTNFESYVAILTYHMEKAYDIIYKDNILIYSIEATKINDKDFEIVTKNFAYLVLKMIGPKLRKEFVELYGNEETVIFNMIEYFNSRFENDEIRKSATENIMEEESPIPTP